MKITKVYLNKGKRKNEEKKSEMVTQEFWFDI